MTEPNIDYEKMKRSLFIALIFTVFQLFTLFLPLWSYTEIADPTFLFEAMKFVGGTLLFNFIMLMGWHEYIKPPPYEKPLDAPSASSATEDDEKGAHMMSLPNGMTWGKVIVTLPDIKCFAVTTLPGDSDLVPPI